MLTTIPAPTTTPSPKQIILNTSGTAVLYTVPTGKTFTGYFTANTTSGAVSINGVYVYSTGGTSGYGPAVVPLTLLAGTVVSGASSTGSIVGVEQ